MEQYLLAFFYSINYCLTGHEFGSRDCLLSVWKHPNHFWISKNVNGSFPLVAIYIFFCSSFHEYLVTSNWGVWLVGAVGVVDYAKWRMILMAPRMVIPKSTKGAFVSLVFVFLVIWLVV